MYRVRGESFICGYDAAMRRALTTDGNMIDASRLLQKEKHDVTIALNVTGLSQTGQRHS